MRIHHLDCGTLRPLGGQLWGGRGNYRKRGHMVCHTLLIEHPTAGLILVDTGLGTQAIDHPQRWLGRGWVFLFNPILDPKMTARQQIRRLGHDPSEVRHIVATHLDLDHAGGLSDFPDARVHLYQEELSAMLNPLSVGETQRYRCRQFVHGPRWQPYLEGGDSWFGFAGARDLDGVDGVVLIPLAGHSRGHAGVAVDTAEGWVLHAGDAYLHRTAIDPAMNAPRPLLTSAFESFTQTIPTQRGRNQARLRELVRDHSEDVSVFCSHDVDEFDAASRE